MPTPSLGAAIAAWLAALLLTALAAWVVFAPDSCESACPSGTQRLLPAAMLLALTWIPFSVATAILLQRRGRDVSPFGLPAGTIGMLQTCYAMAVGVIAWTLVSHRAIHDDLVWGIAVAVAIAGCIALMLTVVARCARS
jgi:hypothetical protein